MESQPRALSLQRFPSGVTLRGYEVANRLTLPLSPRPQSPGRGLSQDAELGVLGRGDDGGVELAVALPVADVLLEKRLGRDGLGLEGEVEVGQVLFSVHAPAELELVALAAK